MKESTHISHIITSVCKKSEIPYKSINPHYDYQKDDAEKLREIYLNLKLMINDLVEIEERHNTGFLRKIIEGVLKELDSADHSIVKITKAIMEEKINES